MQARWLPILMLASCAPLRSPETASTPVPQPVAAPTLLSVVDGLLEAQWKAAGIAPAPAIDDGAFLRRVTLDLIGRVPTLAEAKAFLADNRPDHRALAVDRLLGSSEFAAHWASLYGDLLFGQEGKAMKLERKYDPESWLETAFEQNRGYDKIAYDLLTATGDLHENGAVAFVVARERGGGGPEAVTGAAARIFLGLQIQCAQCHDHPYDTRWKQEDFYGLVAYFARTKAKNEKIDKPDKKDKNAEAAEMIPAAMSAGQGEMMAPETMAPKKKAKPEKTLVLTDVPRGEAKMRRPHTEVDLIVQPRFLGRAVEVRAGESRRQALARAILASDLFAKSMVARTWAQLFGRGIPDPWDDLGGERDAKHPEILVKMADDFAHSGYDFKRLVRTIVLSTAYARSTATSRESDAAVGVFAGAGVRPLQPESLFHALVTTTGANEMGGPRRDPEKVEKRLGASFKEYQFVFGDDEMAEANRFDGSVPQALLLLNGELTNGGTRAEAGGVLANILKSSPDPAARLDDMFLAVYTRRPTADERQPLVEYLHGRKNARSAYEDVFFALITSTEAITNH